MKIKLLLECIANNLLCLFGSHSWEYESTVDHRVRRVCTWCDESQSWIKDECRWNISPWLKGKSVKLKDFVSSKC